VRRAEVNERARKPSIKLWIDLLLRTEREVPLGGRIY
jgi:hypothetical protein